MRTKLAGALRDRYRLDHQLGQGGMATVYLAHDLRHEPGPAAPEAIQARWSPDGRTVYYKAHDAEGHASLWAVSAAGGVPRLLVRFPNPDRQSSRQDFAVDGQRLYFAIEDRQSDVFVAEMISR